MFSRESVFSVVVSCVKVSMRRHRTIHCGNPYARVFGAAICKYMHLNHSKRRHSLLKGHLFAAMKTASGKTRLQITTQTFMVTLTSIET